MRLRGRIVRPDGSVWTLDTAAEIVTDSAGKVSALVGACRDVSDEALAVASLRDLSGQLKRELARERRLIGRELLDATSPILASLYAKLHDRRRPAQDRAE